MLIRADGHAREADLSPPFRMGATQSEIADRVSGSILLALIASTLSEVC